VVSGGELNRKTVPGESRGLVGEKFDMMGQESRRPHRLIPWKTRKRTVPETTKRGKGRWSVEYAWGTRKIKTGSFQVTYHSA